MIGQRDAVTGRLVLLARPLATAALAGTALLGVALVDPNEPGRYPTCPFLAVTGRFCPGCGSLRAMHALTNGDVPTAVGLNVLTVLAVVALSVIWARWAMRSWSGSSRTVVLPATYVWSLLVVVLVFGVLRNLPIGAALAP